jgi:hypothetical protein
VHLIVRTRIIVTAIVGRNEINNLQEKVSCPGQDTETPLIGGTIIVTAILGRFVGMNEARIGTVSISLTCARVISDQNRLLNSELRGIGKNVSRQAARLPVSARKASTPGGHRYNLEPSIWPLGSPVYHIYLRYSR